MTTLADFREILLDAMYQDIPVVDLDYGIPCDEKTPNYCLYICDENGELFEEGEIDSGTICLEFSGLACSVEKAIEIIDEWIDAYGENALVFNGLWWDDPQETKPLKLVPMLVENGGVVRQYGGEHDLRLPTHYHLCFEDMDPYEDY